MLLTTLLFAALQIAAAGTPVPLNSETWITGDDYPDPAVRAAQEGIVEFRLAVSAAGKVTKCEVVTSSGSAVLDMHTCSLISARARFAPRGEADKSGLSAPADRTYQSSVRWILPDGDPVDASRFSPLDRETIDLSIGADGRITRCVRVEAIGSPAAPSSLSLCREHPPGSRYTDPITRGGKPVTARVRITHSSTFSIN